MSDRIPRALRCIRNHLAHHGRTPSVRELAACMGFASPRSAAVVIQELVRQGYVTKRPGGRIQLVRDFRRGGVETVSVPIVGTAPCGSPITAEEDIEGFVRVSTGLASPPHQHFILRAQGDSMDLAGISDGDLVLVRSTPQARDDDRVVALVDGESTIKILRRHDGIIALEPHSSDPRHQPIFADAGLSIQGVVVARLPGRKQREPTPSKSTRL